MLLSVCACACVCVFSSHGAPKRTVRSALGSVSCQTCWKKVGLSFCSLSLIYFVLLKTSLTRAGRTFVVVVCVFAAIVVVCGGVQLDYF